MIHLNTHLSKRNEDVKKRNEDVNEVGDSFEEKWRCKWSRFIWTHIYQREIWKWSRWYHLTHIYQREMKM